MLRIHEIKRNIGEGPEVIPRRIIKQLNIKGLEISDYQLVKESVDARKKTEIKLIYSVDFVPSLPGRKAEDAEAYLLAQCRSVVERMQIGLRRLGAPATDQQHTACS
jgi:uncharacterized FAD-dependent dehydrogenase